MDDQRTGNIYTVYIQRCLQLMVQKQPSRIIRT
jgi:hypothetical protein